MSNAEAEKRLEELEQKADEWVEIAGALKSRIDAIEVTAGASEKRLNKVESKLEGIEAAHQARSIFIPSFPGNSGHMKEFKATVVAFFKKHFPAAAIASIFVLPQKKGAPNEAGANDRTSVQVCFTEAGARNAILEQFKRRGRAGLDNVHAYPALTEKQRKRKLEANDKKDLEHYEQLKKRFEKPEVNNGGGG